MVGDLYIDDRIVSDTENSGGGAVLMNELQYRFSYLYLCMGKMEGMAKSQLSYSCYSLIVRSGSVADLLTRRIDYLQKD